MDTHAQVIQQIRQLAEARGLSVNRLADFSGLSRGYMSQLLRDQKSPSLKTLIKLAEALEVDVVRFFEDVPEPPTDQPK